MEPKNYSIIRSIKKTQGEKIAPYVFEINGTLILMITWSTNVKNNLPTDKTMQAACMVVLQLN